MGLGVICKPGSVEKLPEKLAAVIFSALKDCLLKPCTSIHTPPDTRPPCLLTMSVASSRPKVLLPPSNIMAMGKGSSVTGPGILAVDDEGYTLEMRFKKNGNGSPASPVIAL